MGKTAVNRHLNVVVTPGWMAHEPSTDDAAAPAYGGYCGKLAAWIAVRAMV